MMMISSSQIAKRAHSFNTFCFLEREREFFMQNLAFGVKVYPSLAASLSPLNSVRLKLYSISISF